MDIPDKEFEKVFKKFDPFYFDIVYYTIVFVPYK